MPENNEQPVKFTVSNSAQKAQFYKRPGNRQCRNGHNGDHLADFGPLTTKSGFIMATLRYNCAIMNQNWVGIGTNSAISVRLCSLCHGGSSWRLLKWTIGTDLEAGDVKGCPVFMITGPWPLHERVRYFISLQTNILAFISIKKLSKVYISTFCRHRI